MEGSTIPGQDKWINYSPPNVTSRCSSPCHRGRRIYPIEYTSGRGVAMAFTLADVVPWGHQNKGVVPFLSAQTVGHFVCRWLVDLLVPLFIYPLLTPSLLLLLLLSLALKPFDCCVIVVRNLKYRSRG